MRQTYRLDSKRQRVAILALALICIALIIHEIFGDHGYLALRRQRQELNELERQIQQLQKDNQQLESQIKALKSDPQAIEKLAREKMGLARPGELIFTMPDKHPENEKPSPTSKDTPPRGNK